MGRADAMTDDGDRCEDTVWGSPKHGDVLLAAQRSIAPR
jgi:hypothetical protein